MAIHTRENCVQNGTSATCTVAGVKDYYTCSCGKAFEDATCNIEIADLDTWKAEGGNGYIAPKGHSETEVKNAKEATCTEEGYTGDTYCKVCGEKIENGTSVSAKGHTYGEWITTKEATETETGSKERTCSACDAKEIEEIPVRTPAAYSIISGVNGEWTKGSTTGLAFTSDALFDKFDSVKIDGSTIAATNYIAEEGSTKITLAPAYLETLSVGTHSIEIVSNDGSASTNFTVKAAAQPPVPTTYTVTFNMNGHGTQISAQTVNEGEKASKPADPTASSYTFGGWYADATFSTKFDFSSAITANTTVYAKWTKNSVTPTDPTSPQTGDNSQMFLWIALLFVSSGAFVGTAVWGKKKS